MSDDRQPCGCTPRQLCARHAQELADFRRRSRERARSDTPVDPAYEGLRQLPRFVREFLQRGELPRIAPPEEE